MKYKIGDRIKVVNYGSTLVDGKTGKIIQIRKSGVITVKLDNFNNGHDGDLNDNSNDKWYVFPSSIIKLSTAVIDTNLDEIDKLLKNI